MRNGALVKFKKKTILRREKEVEVMITMPDIAILDIWIM